MFTYRNTETGAEFQSNCQCGGKDWVRVAPGPSARMNEIMAKLEAPAEKPKKTTKRAKKDGNSR